jgi:hypothetical protein
MPERPAERLVGVPNAQPEAIRPGSIYGMKLPPDNRLGADVE